MKTIEGGEQGAGPPFVSVLRVKRGAVGCMRGAGRCVHSCIPIAGARAGWACAHEARVTLEGQGSGECSQQGSRDVLLRWPTIL